ncbi:TIGR03545 family protein [Kaarinaea lacus]
MLKWIRPTGAIVFLVLITVIGLFWWLLADWLLKVSIESGGTKIVGARVELASADLTFSPLGFHLENLQITNPDQPMQNLVQLGQITGSLELMPLLMGQVIIEEMSATAIRLNTERKTSGAVKKTAAETTSQQADAEKSAMDLSAVKEKLPSVDEILAKESLSTLDKTKAFDERIKSERADFEKNLAALPDEAKLKQHEQRIKELTESNIKSVDELNQRKQDLDKLKNEIRTDRDALFKVRDQLKNAKGDLNQQYDALKKAPAEDWERLKSRYGLNATGASNITGLLFGDNAQIWLNRLLAWTEQAQRLLPSGGEDAPKPVQPPRGTGRFINFAATNPMPDFLIRKAKLGLELSAGNIDLEIDDATHQPDILGRPMRLHAAGNQLQNAKDIKIDGVIDHVNPNATKDTITWSLNGFKMADVSISESSSLPLTLTSALAYFKGDIAIKGQAVTANVDAKFNNANWSSTATEGWTGRVAKSLTSIHQFNLEGRLQGDLSSPQISLRSDLDEQLKQAVAGQLKTAQSELETKFKARLNDEIATMAGPYKDQLAFLTDKESSLDQRINNLDKMLKAELKSAVDTKKQEAEDKLKDKLKGLKF